MGQCIPKPDKIIYINFCNLIDISTNKKSIFLGNLEIPFIEIDQFFIKPDNTMTIIIQKISNVRYIFQFHNNCNLDKILINNGITNRVFNT